MRVMIVKHQAILIMIQQGPNKNKSIGISQIYNNPRVFKRKAILINEDLNYINKNNSRINYRITHNLY